MPRFRFGLERLLGLRAHQERAARRNLAQALAAQHQIEQRVETISRALPDLDGEQGPLARAIETGLRVELGRQQRRHELAEQEAHQARASYVLSKREHDILARMRTLRLEVWQQEQQRQEQAQMDEIALQRFAAREVGR